MSCSSSELYLSGCNFEMSSSPPLPSLFAYGTTIAEGMAGCCVQRFVREDGGLSRNRLS